MIIHFYLSVNRWTKMSNEKFNLCEATINFDKTYKFYTNFVTSNKYIYYYYILYLILLFLQTICPFKI